MLKDVIQSFKLSEKIAEVVAVNGLEENLRIDSYRFVESSISQQTEIHHSVKVQLGMCHGIELSNCI
jgi:hypothetical protein